MVVHKSEFTRFLSEQDIEVLKKQGCCPRCGDKGDWINFALVCRYHGKFIG